jgi:hypothetical protein
MFLHAKQVAFAHPTSGDTVRIVSPMPRELMRFLDGLAGLPG